MRNVAVTGSLAVVYAVAICSCQSRASDEESDLLPCEGPTNQVVVEVIAHSSNDGNVFEYRVTNGAEREISGLLIGSGRRNEWKIVPGEPKPEVEAPDGWSGNFGYDYHSEYQSIGWVATDKQARIQPGTSLRGFVVRVGPIAQDLSTVSFRARGGVACHWGTTRPIEAE
jgi:hypothetical protein